MDRQYIERAEMGKRDLNWRLHVTRFRNYVGRRATLNASHRHGVPEVPCNACLRWYGTADSPWHNKYLHTTVILSDVRTIAVSESPSMETVAKHIAQEAVTSCYHQTMVSWNCLISQCIRHGQGQEAFFLFQEMQQQGIMPDKVTYVSIISACVAKAAVVRGRQMHACIVNMPFESNTTLGNALLNLYGKCGSLENAECLFCEMLERDVVSWNTIISLYTHNGKVNEAIGLLTRMPNEGLLPDSFTFNGAISACATKADIAEGRRLHAQIVASEFKENLLIGNTIVHMYGKCSSLNSARRMFEDMAERNIVSWNAIMSAYGHHGKDKEALQIFDRMKQEGVMPDKVSFITLISAHTEGCNLKECEQLHDLIIACRFGSDVSVGNALLNMFGKLGSTKNAMGTFQEMLVRNTISWNGLIAGHVRQGQSKEAVKLFDKMQQQGVLPDKCTFVSILSACGNIAVLSTGEHLHSVIVGSGFESDIVLRNGLINMYGKCGSVNMAQKIFDEMLERDHVSWNSLIASYAQHGYGHQALQLFYQMLSEGLLPEGVAFVSILSACSSKVTMADCHRMHARIVGKVDNFTGNALINMYGKQGCLEDACSIFHEMDDRDAVSWNALISAYVQCGKGKDASQLFDQMLCEGILPVKVTFVSVLSSYADRLALPGGEHIHTRIVFSGLESNVIVGNALINMYDKCGSLDDAYRMFNEMPNRSIISWNVIIAAHVHHCDCEEAFILFDSMQKEGLRPDKFTFVTILSACVGKADLPDGKRVHDDIMNYGFESDVVVGNALLNMYSKCGSLVDARKTFDQMSEQDVISWNSMIAAYAQHGKAKDMFHFFDKMKRVIMPNDVTFISILSACNHAGLVDEGCYYFTSMFQTYGITPVVNHYDCIIDLLGRSGRLDEAETLIRGMPFQPTVMSFMSLLGASKYQTDVERGERVADSVSTMDPGNAAPYVVLSNLYATPSLVGNSAK